MRRFRKKYKRPQILWDRERIDREKALKKVYGLTRKQEIWKAETLLRKYRRMARNLAATKDKQAERTLLTKLADLGMLDKGAGLDDVLGMTVDNVLGRRLQTIVLKRGLAASPAQARQLIVHGHVMLGDRKVAHPSRLVSRDEEERLVVTIVVKKPAAVEEKPAEEAAAAAEEKAEAQAPEVTEAAEAPEASEGAAEG